MIRGLQRVLPASFGGQIAAIVIVGLILSQALAALLYVGLLPQWQRSMRPDAAIAKVDVMVRVIGALAYAERAPTARLLSAEDFQVAFLDRIPGENAAQMDGTDANLAAALAKKTGRPATEVTVNAVATGADADLKQIDVGLAGGGDLSIRTRIGREYRLGVVGEAGLIAFGLFVLAGLSVWITWFVNAPLTRFAHAAERVGVDVHAPPFPEQGPTELRRVIHSFNQMHDRLQRMLVDRTRMLAAISHDLRTPLTRIRLRLETGRAPAEVDRIVADIDAMEAMLTSTLAFVRGIDAAEETEAVDLDLLVQTVTDLISDVGGAVTYDGPGRCRYRCRPQSMMRALANVIANAAKYGGSAHVTLHTRQRGAFVVEIEDAGPGIPAEERARVFEPFYRGPSAAERDSEGMGLGLSITRSIVLAHGGSIELLNAEPRGLLVRITLPTEPSAAAPISSAFAD